MQAVSDDLKKVLAELFSLPEIQKFYLAGGTALALKYGHRVSTDIDLFAEIEFDDKSNILRKIESHFKQRMKLKSEGRNILRFEIDGIKTDFLFWPQIKKMLRATEMLDGFSLASDEDISAMKISAVINRGTKKDFYDVALLIDKLGLGNIIRYYQEKYQVEDDSEAVRCLSDFFEADMEGESAVKVTDFQFERWEGVKAFLKKELSLYLNNK